jgi:hypothetical protein
MKCAVGLDSGAKPVFALNAAPPMAADRQCDVPVFNWVAQHGTAAYPRVTGRQLAFHYSLALKNTIEAKRIPE